MPASKKRIAYILTPVSFGGAEKVSLNLLKTVDRRRFDITPILLVRPWDEETYFARKLAEIDYGFIKIPVALDNSGDLIRVMRVMFMIFSHLKGEKFQLVHTNGYFADICGQPVARILGLTGISTCHGFISLDWKLRIYNNLDKFVLWLCRHVIAVSEKIKEELIKSGIRGSRISVIPNGVPIPPATGYTVARRQELRTLHNIAMNDLVVGYLGRLSAEKGLVHLIQAFSRLSVEKQNLKLVFVGDGPERTKLEKMVEEGGLERSVVFAGFQKEPEDWYHVFDIFVLPSLTEGTPLALLEAMAAGVPVVASAVGGVPRIVSEGINGLLSIPGDSNSLRDKLQILVENPVRSLSLGKSGAQSVQANYGIEKWCQEIEDCYSRL